MKFEISTLYKLPYLGFIKIILINKDLEIELRCTDFKCEDFERRYEHFYKWLLDMRVQRSSAMKSLLRKYIMKELKTHAIPTDRS